MSERPVAVAAATSDTVTSFDQPGAGGYDLSTRFETLKTAMRRAEWHGHLETSALRRAVVPRRKPRRKRSVRGGMQATTLPVET